MPAVFGGADVASRASHAARLSLLRLLDPAAGPLRQVRVAGVRLDGHAGRARLLDPRRTLERGYSITRSEGRLVRAAAQARPGARLSTELADGVITSIVEES